MTLLPVFAGLITYTHGVNIEFPPVRRNDFLAHSKEIKKAIGSEIPVEWRVFGDG